MESDKDRVARKIRQVFPDRDPVEILASLEQYGTGPQEAGRYRVYLAILKLCDEEKLPDPSHYVLAANRDFRDVLAWAEYPNQMKFGPSTDPGKSAAMKQMDLNQYRAWLDKQ